MATKKWSQLHNPTKHRLKEDDQPLAFSTVSGHSDMEPLFFLNLKGKIFSYEIDLKII